MVGLRPNVNPDLYVPTGGNHYLALYEAEIGGKRKRTYLSVPFLEAVKKSQQGLPFFPKSLEQDGHTYALFTALKAKDFVVMYDEHPDEIEWDNPEWMFERLYYLLKWSGRKGEMLFHKHTIAENNPDRTPKPVVIRQVPNTFSARKVRVNRLGMIERM
jgi:hypothetical protein